MIGNRILQRKQQVSADWVAAYRSLPVANISDAMGRFFGAGPQLRPMHDGTVLCGPAVTVRVPPGDNLLLHKALDLAEVGDVVVVDGGGFTSNALIGEMMSAHAAQRGVAGIVIWGAIRDSAELRAASFPVFALGITHRGPFKAGPGEINTPIALDGMTIAPGDLIVGDADGLIAVPFEQIEQIHEGAAAKHLAETQQLERIRQGKNDRTWIDEALRASGISGL
jgi:RraA family protein